jgi:hypothetical protein
VCVAALIALSVHCAAAAEPDVVVTVTEGESLRDIAEQHLGDPDLWVELLRANGLLAVTDVRPGLALTIPVGRIKAANAALAKALDAIQLATREGARVFAPDEIGEAIRLREAGIARRQQADWDGSARLSGEAEVAAAAALAVALEQRDTAAEALLSDRQGWVEGQRPAELVWSDRTINTVLVEEEKVRTLSRSTAQITFRDESRLRLNANSQALIQRMRVDPLSRQEEAKVSLVEGDFYALLAGRSERKSFEVEVPEVETTIGSTNFWVRRDQTGSKFTNYDDGVLEVAAQGQSVSLGRNEGAVVRSGAAPSDKVAVLDRPELLRPADDSVAFNAAIELAWTPTADAAGYWVEVGFDPAFRRMAVSRWGLTETGLELSGLEIGAYYWRVIGLDNFGLPGERSDTRRFHVQVDTTPPFVTFGAPAEGSILRDEPVEVTGETEPGAVLELNGRPIPIDAAGRFAAAFAPEPGRNELLLKATDAAGNVTERRRDFVFMPDQATAVVFDEALPRRAVRHFVTARDVISLAGSTTADAQLAVVDATGRTRAAGYADPAGRFGLNVPLEAAMETFAIEVTAGSGFTSRDHFTVEIDEEPPAIRLETLPPPVTAVEWLALRGEAPGAVELLLNGRPVRLFDERFDEALTLLEGTNRIVLVATDLVGNVRVENLEVELDQVPPELLRHALSRDRVTAGGSLTVEVVARDASGLTQAAPFSLRIGQAAYTDFLTFNPSSETYSATVILPPEMSGRVALRDVELRDYAGNSRRYLLE